MTRHARAAVIAVTGAALFMVVLDNLIVAATLPTLQHSLHTSLDSIEWVIDAYILTFGVALLTGAALGDHYGRRRMFIAGLALFTASSAAAGMASSVDALVVARIFQGLGGAVVLPLTLTIVSTAFPPERRGFALGLWSAIAGVGTALGPIAGGLLVSVGSWHLIFWVNVPVGIVAALAALRVLPADRGAREPLDPVGMALVATGLFAVIEATVRAPRIGWASAQTLIAYALGAAILVAFARYERRSDHAMIPSRLFADPRSAQINVSGFLLGMAIFAAFVLLIQYLVTDQGQGAVAAGLETLPWTIMPLLVSPFSGRLGRRIAPAALTAAGLTLLGLGLTALAVAVGAGAGPASLIPALVVTGTGIGITLPNLAAVAVGSVLPADIGKASGLINTSRQIGAVAGVAVCVAVAQATGSIAAAIAVAAGAAGIGALAAVWDRVRDVVAMVTTPSRA